MKSKSNSRLGHLIKSIFNVRYWFDWDRIKAFTQYLYKGAKTLFILEETTDTESFEAAKKRLKLTDNDLLIRQKGLLRLVITMLIIAILSFSYTLYLFFDGSLKGGVVGLVLTCVALTLAFRYHFWYFQIKEKKLGCTFHQWFKQGLMGEK